MQSDLRCRSGCHAREFSLRYLFIGQGLGQIPASIVLRRHVAIFNDIKKLWYSNFLIVRVTT